VTDEPPSYPPPPPPPPGGYPPPSGDYGYPPPTPAGYGGYPPPAPGGYGSYPPPAPVGYGGYGPPAPGGYGYGPPQSAGINGMAIASLVCSLLGMLCCGVGGLLGIILGVISLGQIKERGQDGRGLAIAGIAIGGAAIVLGVILAIFSAVLNHSPQTDSGAPPAVVIVAPQEVSAVCA
jgi:hypothetical protein